MTYAETYLARVRWALLLILLLLAPFHAFLITWAKSLLPGGSLLSVLSAWREIFVLAICLIISAELFFQKIYFKNLDRLDWWIISFGLLALAFLPFQRSHLSQWLLGVRFDVMPFVFLFFVRRVAWGNSEKLKKIVVVAAVVVVVFGLLHAKILPHDFLAQFGYSDYQGSYRPDIPIAACQYLEGTDRVCRATSTFGGPTRYGTYLLLVFGLLAGVIKKNVESRMWNVGFFILAAASAVLTYSRSIWVGALFMAIVGGGLFFKNLIKLFTKSGTGFS